MCLVFTRAPDEYRIQNTEILLSMNNIEICLTTESYRRRLRSLLLCLCESFER